MAVGTKIWLTQTTSKYFHVTGKSGTTITVKAGTDYTLANAAITAPYFSNEVTPVDFPSMFSYTPTLTNFTLGSGSINYAKFRMDGSKVFMRVKITLSSSTVSGLIGIGVPVDMNSNYSAAVDTPIHSGQLNDATGSRWEPWLAFGTASRLDVYYPNDSNQLSGTTSSTPFNWGNSDNIMITAEYDA